jgi:ADP-ribosylation factor family
VETVEYKNISFTVWDVGGQDKVRPALGQPQKEGRHMKHQSSISLAKCLGFMMRRMPLVYPPAQFSVKWPLDWTAVSVLICLSHSGSFLGVAVPVLHC